MRATFLIIEVESPEGISTRKLVVETAKLNVITAYSGKEGLDLFRKFPAVDGVVVHHGILDVRYPDIIAEVKRLQPGVPVVLLASANEYAREADHVVSTHEPQALLEVLQTIGNPAAAA